MAVSFNTWMLTVLAFLTLGLGFSQKTWTRVVQLALANLMFLSGLCSLYMKIQEGMVFHAIALLVSLSFLYTAIMFGTYSLGKYVEKNKDNAN